MLTRRQPCTTQELPSQGRERHATAVDGRRDPKTWRAHAVGDKARRRWRRVARRGIGAPKRVQLHFWKQTLQGISHFLRKLTRWVEGMAQNGRSRLSPVVD